MRLIAQGAEAKIYQDKDRIIKHRIKKNYRLAEIDTKLRKLRTRAEARLIARADRAGVNVPQVLEADEKTAKLEIEHINGVKIRDCLTPELCRKIATQIKKMHDGDVIHGDLTTSNMILLKEEVYLIDFGLGSVSNKPEDKAVDLHLFKECLKSKHFDIWEACWKNFLEGYTDKVILERLEQVETRGKYKPRNN